MSVIEKAVVDLANALDTLEAKIETRLDEQNVSGDAISAARRQARAAKDQAEIASKGVGAAISDIKALLAKSETNGKG